MLRLPVSGREVVVRLPDGADDLLIQESQGNVVARALALLARVARPADAGAFDWSALCVTDFEVLAGHLRAAVLGPRVACTFDCPGTRCGERVEVGFALADYMAAARPGRPRGVVPVPDRPGWFQLDGTQSLFRLPTAADQSAVLGRPDAADALAARCFDPPDTARSLRLRAERAMAVMAPEVSRPVTGRCPACGATVRAGLHLTGMVLAELRRAAAGLHEEVHLLASTYHWAEAEILALPRQRRQGYATRARQLLAGAA